MSTDNCNMVKSSNTTLQMDRITITLSNFQFQFLFYLDRELSSIGLRNVSEIRYITAHLCCLLCFKGCVNFINKRNSYSSKIVPDPGGLSRALKFFLIRCCSSSLSYSNVSVWLCELPASSFQGLPEAPVDQRNICTLGVCGRLSFIGLSQVFSTSALLTLWAP